MTPEIHDALEIVFADKNIPTEQAFAAVSAVMEGKCSEVEIAALLTSLRMKGEAFEEIVGAARAMQEKALAIPTTQTGLLDTCGTGGDALHTFNISTATALVAAAAGVPVAKHGNRSVSSSSGSADVLEALGLNLNLTAEQVGQCIDEIGIGFCFAPLFHGAMKYAAPVRKQLGFRTIFNLLGPLTNPAKAEFQLLGANRVETAEKLANALSQLGKNKAIVVCGADELDEVSLWGETTAFIVTGGNVEKEVWTPNSFGLPTCKVDDLVVNSAAESAQVLQDLFSGQAGPRRDIVLANTAAALLTANYCETLGAGVKMAAEAIDSGKTAELLGKLIELTRSF